MESLIIAVIVVAGWVLLAVPVGLVIGRMSRRADLGSEPRTPALMLQNTGAVGGFTR